MSFRLFCPIIIAAFPIAAFARVATAEQAGATPPAEAPHSKATADPKSLKETRETLRHLKQAIAQNQGTLSPDPTVIAKAISEMKPGELKKLAESNGGTFTSHVEQGGCAATVTVGVSPTSCGVLDHGGTLTLSGTNTYTGPTMVGTGTIVGASNGTTGNVAHVGSGTLVLSGTNTDRGPTAVSVESSGAITQGQIDPSTGAESVRLTLGTGSTVTYPTTAGYRWIQFPPDVEVPAEQSSAPWKLTLASAAKAGSLTLARGTRVVKAPVNLPLPAGALELPVESNQLLTLSGLTDAGAPTQK